MVGLCRNDRGRARSGDLPGLVAILLREVGIRHQAIDVTASSDGCLFVEGNRTFNIRERQLIRRKALVGDRCLEFSTTLGVWLEGINLCSWKGIQRFARGLADVRADVEEGSDFSSPLPAQARNIEPRLAAVAQILQLPEHIA
jgi:hypothetical protein